MLPFIIALFLNLGIISSGDDVNNRLIQEHQELIQSHIVEDDLIID